MTQSRLLVVCTLAAAGCRGAAAPSPQPPASPPAYEVQAGWPALPPGVELGQASGVAVDARDRVYVFHRAGRGFHNDRLIDAPTVFVFDGPTGRLLDRWGAGKFVVPHGIAVDADGNLWLTDVGLDRVFKFSPEGRELLSIGRQR